MSVKQEQNALIRSFIVLLIAGSFLALGFFISDTQVRNNEIKGDTQINRFYANVLQISAYTSWSFNKQISMNVKLDGYYSVDLYFFTTDQYSDFSSKVLDAEGSGYNPGEFRTNCLYYKSTSNGIINISKFIIDYLIEKMVIVVIPTFTYSVHITIDYSLISCSDAVYYLDSSIRIVSFVIFVIDLLFFIYYVQGTQKKKQHLAIQGYKNKFKEIKCRIEEIKKEEGNSGTNSILTISTDIIEDYNENLQDMFEGGEDLRNLKGFSEILLAPIQYTNEQLIEMLNLVSRYCDSISKELTEYQEVLHVGNEGRLKYETVAIDAFDEIRRDVVKKLDELLPNTKEKFDSAFEDLRKGGKESISHALTSCRRILYDLADLVFPPRSEAIDGHKLTADKYLNRLQEFIKTKIKSESENSLFEKVVDHLGALLEKLNKVLDKGVHSDVGLFSANIIVILTLLTSSEVLNLYTDKAGQDKAGQDKAGQDKAGQDKIDQNKDDQDSVVEITPKKK